MMKKKVALLMSLTILFSTVSFAAESKTDTITIDESIAIGVETAKDDSLDWESLEINGNKIKYENAIKIVEETDSFINNNPNKSQEEINTFVDEKIDQYRTRRFRRGYIDDVANKSFNPQEKELYNQNKFVGFRIALAAKTASSEAKSRYKSSELYLGNGDAFRHAYWNALMDNHVGTTWAKKWADAHEYGSANSQGIDRKMDLYNNGIGRKLNDGSTNANLANIVQHEVRKGNLKRIVKSRLILTDATGEK